MDAMAIVWACVLRSAIRFILIVAAVDIRDWLEPHRLRLATLRRLGSYGVTVSLAGIAAFGMRRWDNLLVSRLFGPAVMGAYNYAYNLADTPAVAVGEPIGDVIAASFPHVEPQNRARAVVRACTMLALIMFPLAIGLGAVAPTLTQAFFNKKWADVGTMLVFLSVLSAPRPLANLLSSYFYARQQPQAVLKMEWLTFAAVMASIATVGRLGINYTCAAVGTVFVLRALFAMWVAGRQDAVSMSTFLKPLAPLLIACVPMVAAVLLIRPVLVTAGLPAATRLVIEIALGAAGYLGGVALFAREACRDLLGVARSALARR
jgi:PST family polysaccharide transporter